MSTNSVAIGACAPAGASAVMMTLPSVAVVVGTHNETRAACVVI